MASANVFLAPCDPERFDRTVRSAVELTEYSDRPAALNGMESARLWGIPAGSNDESYFERMGPDDLVLFYGDGEYVGTGTVGTAFADETGWASDTFWDDESTPFVYTVEGFVPVSVPRAAVNTLFGYSEGYTPNGFMRVADDRVTDDPAVIKRAVEKYSEKHA